jgi:hypothetical protein
MANPIILTAAAPDGGTVRFYRDGMVDAVDGIVYSLSPGFASLAELLDWIEQETAARRRQEWEATRCMVADMERDGLL